MQISQLNVNSYAPVAQEDSVVPRSQSQETVKAAPAPAISASKEASSAERNNPDRESVKQAIAKINETVRMLDTNVQFTVDSDTGIDIVKVVDTQTKDVIRQFPSKEVLAIAKALDQLKGLILRDKA